MAPAHDSTATDDLVRQSRRLIEAFSLSEARIFTLWKAYIELDKVLEAMLFHAHEAGGDKAQRYVSLKVLACGGMDASHTANSSSSNEDCFRALRGIALLWLTELLFAFKNPGTRNPKQRMDEYARTDEFGFGDPETPFMRQLLLRDGYCCPISGLLDRYHPCPPAVHRWMVFLRACHILPQALGDLGKRGEGKESVLTLTTTVQMLRGYTYLPERINMDRLPEMIESPENGLLLQADCYLAFNSLAWGLQEVARDTYTMQTFDDTWETNHEDPHANVMFKDHSNELEPGHPPLPTPNPAFLAVHLVIAKVANMCGASSFFDAILKKWAYDGDDAPSIITWADLRLAMAVEDTRELLQNEAAGEEDVAEWHAEQ